jgi:RNA polymerase sigma factor (sigma-70 family)
MDNRSRFGLVNEAGRPFSAHVEDALVSLVPKFQRHFPVLRDDLTLVEVLEEAGRRIERREDQGGRIERLHGYAWVTLRSIATSRLRRGDGRMAQRTLTAEEGEAALDATPTREGTADHIERTILLREVLDTLTLDERLVCMWKKAGFSSQEIADRRGGTAAAVDTMLSRVRRKVRRLFGGNTGGARRG